MRIAIYHNLPSGGAKRSLQQLVRGLAPNHLLDVFTFSCAEHDFADLRPYIVNQQVTAFRPGRLFKRPFGRLNQLVYLANMWRLDLLDRTLAAQIDRTGYDLVFVHHCRYRQSPGILRFLRTPTAYYCHEPPRLLYDPPLRRPHHRAQTRPTGFGRLDPLPGLYRHTLMARDRQNAQHATKILVNSHHSQELIWRLYGQQPIVCYLGVDLETFRHIPCEREPIMLSVGTINPVKGYDLLIEGLALMPTTERPNLVIISNYADAKEKAFLEGLANQKAVNMQIKLLVSDAQLAGWYSRSYLTGYSPVLEPFGLVPLESMACETPVVGVREGGVRETVQDGATGRLVERDPAALAAAVSDLLAHPELVADMGRQGREWVENCWTWEQSVARVEHELTCTAEGVNACRPQ